MRFSIRKQLYKKCLLLHKPIWMFVVSVLGSIIYWEYYVYYWPTWFDIKCEHDCTRILLVADPQIIGLRNEILHAVTPISIWDNDRYLTKTYTVAKKHVQPHIVLFLGDLFDEGSIAFESEYYSYVDRFSNVFSLNDQSIQYLFVPGDNDIGGEGYEPVKDNKIKMFEKAFRGNQINEIRNITFYGVNGFKRVFPEADIVEELAPDDSSLRVVISHIPLLFKPSLFSDKVMSKLRPHLLFAGHEHSSMIVSNDPIIQVRHVLPVAVTDARIHSMYLRMDETYEVIVPTCSYRMGTFKMGYGYAVIENNELHYTVLWSPSRFHQLVYYLVILVANTWYFIYCKCRECWRIKSNKTNYIHQ